MPFGERKNWDHFWLINPLDGTKEFIKRNGEFMVNISLVHRNAPVIGVIYAPVKDALYCAAKGEGAYKIVAGKKERLRVKARGGRLTIIGSRSHATKEFDDYVQGTKNKYGELSFISAGSSLKFCLVTEGAADIYPRLGPTMEWDTAACQIIVEEAGRHVFEAGSSRPLTYNKERLLNPHFLVFGGTTYV